MQSTAKRFGAVLLATVTLAACAHNPEPDLDPEIVEAPVKIAPSVSGPVAYGDCAEALRRASQKSDLFVDRVPSPKTNLANALKGAPVAVRRAKYNEVKVSVLVDTLGKPEMKSWAVINTTNAWLASSLKTAVTKTKFDPAMLAGCKVPRLWVGTFTSGTPPKQANTQ
jgi:hypothetical protein